MCCTFDLNLVIYTVCSPYVQVQVYVCFSLFLFICCCCVYLFAHYAMLFVMFSVL